MMVERVADVNFMAMSKFDRREYSSCGLVVVERHEGFYRPMVSGRRERTSSRVGG